MSRQRRNFSAKFKSDLVIELLKGEKDLNTLATENNIQPNLLRNWKKEFLNNASAVFDDKREENLKEKLAEERKEKAEYAKKVGQLTIIETAQKLSDRINPQGLHKVLDIFARRYSPVPESLGLGYTWTVQQIECATDIMFRKPEYLAPIYDEIIHTAIYTVKPDNIATFLGQRITYNCTKEIGTNYNQRILGTRIKHHMGDVSIKMYDKFGCVLRIESTCNDISTFRVEREVQHRDGTSDIRKAPLKKSIYSLYQLFTILKSANYRYLEFISSFDDHSSGRKKLDEVSHSRREKERTYRGFNFFDSRDLSVLEAISKGEYMTFGIQGKQIRQHLPKITPSAMTRIFKRLKVHGLIEKIPGSYKYLITALGKEIIAAGLSIKNLILVPALTS